MCDVDEITTPTLDDLVKVVHKFYSHEDEVRTLEATRFGVKFYAKEPLNKGGLRCNRREAHIAATIDQIPVLSPLFCQFRMLSSGTLVSKGVPGIPVHLLPAHIKKSTAYQNEVTRMLETFGRYRFAHGDLHGNNVFYDSSAERIWVIDVGQSQFEYDLDVEYSTWMLLAPREFQTDAKRQHFQFFRRLDVALAWYEVVKGVVDKSEDVFAKLQDLIQKKYGWRVRFGDDSASFHQRVVSAIVDSLLVKI
jgi:hypothetical protein